MCVECHLSIDSYSNLAFLDSEGRYHCLDGPARIYRNGTVLYYRHGKMHRDDGPAVIWNNGTIFYYHHDELHRLGGPARIWSDGRTEYWENGERIEHVC